MQAVWIALVVFLVVAAIGLIVGGGLTLFFRFRSGQHVQIPLRALLRVYLYILVIVGLLLFTQGFSELVRAGLGAALDKDYSYYPVYVGFKGEPRAPQPVELKDRAQLTEQELEELALIQADREAKNLEEQRQQRKEGLDLVVKTPRQPGARWG